jgi:non-canonical poly(A) RNA polymerase PAPD5/7
MDDQKRESVLRSMAACLRRNNLATNVQVIARAKVPIVKFVCTYGKYKVDISVNQTNGLDASLFVQEWLQRCPALRPLIMATKLLLSQRGMSEVFSGGLGSYSVICLVISHMQMHPRIQRGEIDPSRNLGVLLLEFLELYGKNFGYDEVGISIIGRGKYFRKAARGWKDDRRPFMLSIEDPGDPTNDISKGSFSILNVRQTFGGAFDIMTAVMCQKPNDKKRRDKKRGQKDEDEEAREALINGARLGESDKDPESLLGNIIGVNREMLKARKDVSVCTRGSFVCIIADI